MTPFPVKPLEGSVVQDCTQSSVTIGVEERLARSPTPAVHCPRTLQDQLCIKTCNVQPFCRSYLCWNQSAHSFGRLYDPGLYPITCDHWCERAACPLSNPSGPLSKNHAGPAMYSTDSAVHICAETSSAARDRGAGPLWHGSVAHRRLFLQWQGSGASLLCNLVPVLLVRPVLRSRRFPALAPGKTFDQWRLVKFASLMRLRMALPGRQFRTMSSTSSSELSHSVELLASLRLAFASFFNLRIALA